MDKKSTLGGSALGHWLKVILWLVLALVIYGAGSWIYINSLNYVGYCTWGSQAYDMKLTPDERLRAAVSGYLRNQTLIDLNEIELIENGNKRQDGYIEALQEKFSLSAYSDVESFMQENPNCCERTWGEVEGDQFGFWERAGGGGDGMFIFNHKIRYKDRSGVDKEIYSKNTYFLVDNCGRATYRSYF